jgi:VCBS repeat-containing protein
VGVLGALVMGAVGVIFSAYAAGQGADPVEAESFTHPPGTQVVLGDQYSGGKALKITSGRAVPTKQVTITETSNVLVRARAGQSGGSPTLTIRVDGTNAGARRITSASLSDYLYSGVTLEPGTYTIGLKGRNLAKGRYLFVDVLSFPAVTPPSDPPVAVEDSATVGEDSGATTIDVLANDTDIDGGTKTMESVTQPDHGAVTITNSGSGLTYEPDENYCNGGSPTDDFTYTLNGGSTATVAVTVTCVNDAPVADDQSLTTNEDNPKDVTLGGSDVDGDNLTYHVVDGPQHGTLSGSGANLTYTPEANYNGADSFTYKATDGTADSGPATVTITVHAVNDAPSFDLGSDQTVVNTAGCAEC